MMVPLSMTTDNDIRDNSADAVPVLPKLLAICREIDKVFGRFVGPIAAELCAESLKAWTLNGRKTKPADLIAYIGLLSSHIPSSGQRLAFETEARRYIKLTN